MSAHTDARAASRPARGDELELEVTALAFGGEGVARLGEGRYVVFVAGAVPGDRVRALVYKRKRSYAHARTLEVLEPSPERIPPLADHPGVPWQVLRYERQLEIKAEQVSEALSRLGRLTGRDDLTAPAERTLRVFHGLMEERPFGPSGGAPPEAGHACGRALKIFRRAVGAPCGRLRAPRAVRRVRRS